MKATMRLRERPQITLVACAGRSTGAITSPVESEFQKVAYISRSEYGDVGDFSPPSRGAVGNNILRNVSGYAIYAVRIILLWLGSLTIGLDTASRRLRVARAAGGNWYFTSTGRTGRVYVYLLSNRPATLHQ